MKTVNIKLHGIGRYEDKSPFLIANEDLTLKLNNLPKLTGEFYYSAKLNGKEHKVKLKDDTVILPVSYLEPGRLEASVQFYNHGHKLSEYIIDPLLISKPDNILSAEPQLSALESSLRALREDYENYVKAAEERIEVLQAKLTAFKSEVTGEVTKAISVACNEMLTKALQAEDENASTLNEKITALGDYIFNGKKKKR